MDDFGYDWNKRWASIDDREKLKQESWSNYYKLITNNPKYWKEHYDKSLTLPRKTDLERNIEELKKTNPYAGIIVNIGGWILFILFILFIAMLSTMPLGADC